MHALCTYRKRFTNLDLFFLFSRSRYQSFNKYYFNHIHLMLTLKIDFKNFIACSTIIIACFASVATKCFFC